MIKALVSDFSQVLLFRKDDPSYGQINELHESLYKNPNYNIWDHFTLNTKLLDYFQKISSHIDCYIFTSLYIQEHPPLMATLKPFFKDIYSAARLGVSKSTQEAYTKVTELISTSPNETLFIDDTTINIQAAKKAGLHIVHYRDNESAIAELHNILGK